MDILCCCCILLLFVLPLMVNKVVYIYCYDGPLLCSFNVVIKGLNLTLVHVYRLTLDSRKFFFHSDVLVNERLNERCPH